MAEHNRAPARADVLPAAARVGAANAAAADRAANAEANEALRKTAMEFHFWRAILAWCNSDRDETTSQTFACNDLSLVTGAWLIAVETELEARGYTVTRDDNTRKMTVSAV